MGVFPYQLILVFLLLLIDLSESRRLWSKSPASVSDVIRTAYPIGNGRLGLMPFGPAGSETLNLNIDSLWSGGPFQIDNYTGGNPSEPVYQALPGIRDWIFQNGTGNVSQLLGNGDYYGSYRVAGNVSVQIAGMGGTGNGTYGTSETSKGYERSLDLTTGVHTTSFSQNGAKFQSNIYCSYPDQVCVYALSSTQALPEVTIRLDNELVDDSLQTISCKGNEVRMTGVTQLGPPEGMRYEAVTQLIGGIHGQCKSNALVIPSTYSRKTLAFVVAAGTNYDQKAGNAAAGYSFKGTDPSVAVLATSSRAANKSEPALRKAAVDDYSALSGSFTLTVPNNSGSANLTTADALSRYSVSGAGDAYLEATLFDYGRHLFISSSRPGSLPPNLQGRWATGLENAWSGDYHANINLQMNHWGMAQTGLAPLMTPVFDYMQNTWVPRGQETARLLYGAGNGSTAWVVHDEINIFGHTAMKNDAQWANYPAAAAWMMQHVYDYWSYEGNQTWLLDQGWPLMAGVAEFWLGMLVEDRFFNDSRLVTAGCNSPEHGPTTFGCVHDLQLIRQIFETAVETADSAGAGGDLVPRVQDALGRLDPGVHISGFGTLKEWKLPDSFGYDFPNDTHRHLSHLVGWYPGWSVAGYLDGLNNQTIKDAVAESLINRGLGNGPDANAGWEKVWRGACWARLGNEEKAYQELRYALDENFVDNGLSK